MKRVFQFQVQTVNSLGNAILILEGRCCEGKIVAGDLFTRMYRQEWKRQEDGFRASSLAPAVDAAVRVLEVRSVPPNCLDIGQAGVLVVAVDRPETVQADHILEGRT